jgi:hypothetical protein
MYNVRAHSLVGFYKAEMETMISGKRAKNDVLVDSSGYSMDNFGEKAAYRGTLPPNVDHGLNFLESADPSDTSNPQNWSSTKKALLFGALMSSSILADGQVLPLCKTLF